MNDIGVVHQQILSLLLELDKICRDKKIEYTLHGGTLLGAVREKGFIPWDDDADISMTRDEFEKLKRVFENEQSDCYLRGNVKIQFCSKLNADVWVDIFICDYVSEKKIIQKFKKNLLTFIDVMNRDNNSIKYSNLEKYSKGKKLVFKIIYNLGKFFPNSKKQKWYLDISKKKFLGKKKFHIRSNDQYVGRNIVMPVKWMMKFENIDFEGYKLRTTSNYKELLTSSYGVDYMTPVKDTRNGELHNQIRNGEGGFTL